MCDRALWINSLVFRCILRDAFNYLYTARYVAFLADMDVIDITALQIILHFSLEPVKFHAIRFIVFVSVVKCPNVPVEKARSCVHADSTEGCYMLKEIAAMFQFVDVCIFHIFKGEGGENRWMSVKVCIRSAVLELQNLLFLLCHYNFRGKSTVWMLQCAISFRNRVVKIWQGWAAVHLSRQLCCLASRKLALSALVLKMIVLVLYGSLHRYKWPLTFSMLLHSGCGNSWKLIEFWFIESRELRLLSKSKIPVSMQRTSDFFKKWIRQALLIVLHPQ